MDTLVDKFVGEILDDIKNNRLKLPILPEIAFKVRAAVNDTNAAATAIAKAVSSDASIAARLLQVVNSPLYRGANAINNLQSAIARLGPPLVRNLVTSLILKQLFQTKSSLLHQRMQVLWEHSTQVAAISHVLARKFTRLQPDEAMLAGLIHDIGVLPILQKAENHPELLADVAQLNDIIDKLHPSIGRLILEAWKFPPELVAAAAEHENLTRISDQVDYTDIVTVANLHSYLGSKHRHAKVKFSDVPAFTKLGLTPETSLSTMEEAAAEMKDVKSMLAA
ncbi:MAG TPA: HDOD domain-containing protein [Acidiferrobacterales bacterium]|nr:HDOD domain-containing protein [Acidiferrobacterales bacterium]